MSNFKNIQVKLQQFIRKFYINELIKGALLFFTIGLLYFIFTLFIEYLLWLKPLARTILFWLFIIIELGLLVKYILFPIFKLMGLKKGITEFEASSIIGKYFPEVNDKLLNMLQLKQVQQSSELIEASIEQKSLELQPIPFISAVDFKKNKKYVKYALIPLLVWGLVYITGNINIFNDSFTRVVKHNTQFQPPAPFTFVVLNKSLNVIEGQPFVLNIEVVGNSIPEDAKINLDDENYYLEHNGSGQFQYTFSSVKSDINFSVEANGVVSKDYKVKVIATPVISNLKMVLQYPSYTGKKSEVIQNTGNAIVPQGTNITWQILTHQTENISFNSVNEKGLSFVKNSDDYFTLSKRILKPLQYNIATSNQQLKNHELLNFTVDVISDELPKIMVKSDIDSISRGPVQFIGQLNDDYGINKLQLIYYDKNNPESFKSHVITIDKSAFTDFYYIFPEGITIDEGVDYEMYFEVFDNDAVNGNKKSKSKLFSYYNKTSNEIKDELLKEQKDAISNISKDLNKSKKANDDLEKFQKELQKKADINWNDTKKLEEFIKRQNQYEKIFQEQTKQLDKNLSEQPKIESLAEKKEELKKRIQEAKELAKQEKMLDELKELTEKLQKEDLVQKLKEITKKNKQNEQSLERILELTKRFYVEQKANQIKEKLEKLSEKQEQLAKEETSENNPEKQDKINKEFDAIKKDFNEMDKQNNDLKRPMKFPDNSALKKEIDYNLEKASKDLENKESESAKKNQKNAAKKMKEMSKSLEKSMAASEGESIDEDIDDLRKIVENLIEFSFQQEDLMTKFSSANTNQTEFPKHLKQQQKLKVYFEHIDDSLYVLSLRVFSMGSAIQKEVSDAHFNMDESLQNFSENLIEQGISNQQFVVTAANNLANSLSNLLESLMNASPSFGKGKGNSNEFSLPDIIQKQGDLLEKMKDGLKNGKESGSKPGDEKGKSGKSGGGENGDEQSNNELYEIYKQQSLLKEALKDILGEGENGNKPNDVVKEMEALEKELLEKGFNAEVIKRMQLLSYELLKLEKAKKEQGENKERKSETNIKTFEDRAIDKLKLQNQYFNYNEILNRQSLPLRTIYKKKVQEYFKTEEQ